jgi:recombination protein RecA
VKAKVVKNKVAPPFKVAEFDILFGSGISYEADVLNAAIKHGVVKKAGASYSYEGERLGSGFDNVREKLRGDKPLLHALEKKVVDAIKNAEPIVPESEEEKE